MKKQLLQILIILVSTLIILSGCSLATSSGIKMESDKVVLYPGSEVQISVKLEQLIEKFLSTEMDVNYNEDIIEKIEINITDSLKDNVRTGCFNYITKHFNVSLINAVDLNKGDEILKINVKIKEDLDIEKLPLENYITLNYVSIVDDDIKEYWFDEEAARYTFTVTNQKSDDLFLTTKQYKIGEGNTTIYEKGDKYITQIPENTDISSFKANLTTNGNISVYNADGEEVTNLEEELVKTGMKLKVTKEGSEDIELSIIVDGQEELYLLTDIYKIGDVNQTIYELGDTCISKIPAKTTLEEFIAGLTTNGNISVYNADGEEQTNLEELTKTHMILKVSKEGQEDIQLVISVIGDTSGDGLVQADDLADTIKKVLGNIELTQAQLKAIDMNENGNVEADDLADEVKLVLG